MKRKLSASPAAKANLNRQLEACTVELRAARAEIDALTHSVSHDLRTPLVRIGGFADLLFNHTRNRLDDNGRHYLRRIVESTYHMGCMIDEILKLSRLNCTELNPMHLDLRALVRDIVQDLSRSDRDRRVNWQIDRLPPVEADPRLLRIALENLLGNAFKFTRNREVAQIKIGSRRGEAETIIFVRDNGIGFKPDQKSRLFRIFQRLHVGAGFEGSGVGLAQVRRVIARHGGRTWAEPNPQAGATFYFSLPDSPACLLPDDIALASLSRSPMAA